MFRSIKVTLVIREDEECDTRQRDSTEPSDAEVASPCWICPLVGKTLLTSYKEILNDSETIDNPKDLLKIVQIAVGSGQYEKKDIDELNEQFMKDYYPDAKSNAYSWPAVYEYQHAGESTEVALGMDANSDVPGLTKKAKKPQKQNKNTTSTKTKNGDEPVKYSTVQEERKGEISEEIAFRMLCAMFKQKGIPSFVIHGYKWNEDGYPEKLKTIYKELTKKKRSDKDWELRPGELDLLISIPGQSLLSIEIKGRKNESAVTRSVTDTFKQCKNKLIYMLTLNSDFFHDKNIPFIKVSALPNISRDQLGNICDNCSKHILTKDELQNTEEVSKWYSNLINVLGSNQMSSDFTGDLHEKMIGRLLGPRSLRLIDDNKSRRKPTSEQIIGEHGTVEKVHIRWFQFNEQQLKVVMDNPKLVWITGEPGSGKTLLLKEKIDHIRNRHGKDDDSGESFKVILCPGSESERLYDIFKEEFPESSNKSSCLAIKKFEIDNKQSEANTCNNLPKIINDFQENNGERVLHIFIDEATFLLKGTNWSKFKEDWEKLDLERLGFVWVIQNPLSTDDDESGESLEQTLAELGFKKVHLEYVMRMSKENVAFASHVLGRPTLISGHGVAGPIPMLYSMACICTLSKGSVHCQVCIHKRQALLIVQILKDLCLKGTKKDRMSISDIVIFMNDDHKFLVEGILKKYRIKFPDRHYDEVRITDSSDFRGCEQKVVIVDLLELSLDVKNLMESLTRCVARLILMDTGRSHEELLPLYENESRQEKISTLEEETNKYEDLRRRISDAIGKGLADTKEVRLTHFDDEELADILQ